MPLNNPLCSCVLLFPPVAILCQWSSMFFSQLTSVSPCVFLSAIQIPLPVPVTFLCTSARTQTFCISTDMILCAFQLEKNYHHLCTASLQHTSVFPGTLPAILLLGLPVYTSLFLLNPMHTYQLPVSLLSHGSLLIQWPPVLFLDSKDVIKACTSGQIFFLHPLLFWTMFKA